MNMVRSIDRLIVKYNIQNVHKKKPLRIFRKSDDIFLTYFLNSKQVVFPRHIKKKLVFEVV